MDVKEQEAADEAAKLAAEAAKVEEEAKKKEEESKGFTQDEFVSKNQYNQALRKLREMELEKIELATKVAPAERPIPVRAVAPAPVAQPTPPPVVKSIWDEEEEVPPVIAPIVNTIDEEAVARMVDERMKPIFDAQKESFEKQKKNDRTAFFESNPKYLTDAVAWEDLISEMNRSINPNSGDSYFEQLNKARILLESSIVVNPEADKFNKDTVVAAANVVVTSGAKVENPENITPEERALMKEYGISEEGMQAYKRKISSGDMTHLGML